MTIKKYWHKYALRHLYSMDADELRRRTQQFAVAIINLVQNLPDQNAAKIIGNQLLRCGMSVGANYRAACRARSPADFVAKLKIVEEECDESIYWMELLLAMQIVNDAAIDSLNKEAGQILRIVVASIKTARANIVNRKSSIVNRQ
ncbi:MAG: four helix bundle protein [Acidobacteriota bacterium]|nr:four helix bundle protein [Acidobacteriota bacterium]